MNMLHVHHLPCQRLVVELKRNVVLMSGEMVSEDPSPLGQCLHPDLQWGLADLLWLAGAKNYDQAMGAAGALGWRLTSDEMAALDAASDRCPPSQGLPFENW